jgi:peptide/nickel transport system permease protein
MLKNLFNYIFLILFLLLVVIPWENFLNTGFELSNMLATPSFSHPLGTDNMGRDLLYRISQALRSSVLPLWGGVLLASACGCALGVFTIQVRVKNLFSPFIDAFKLFAVVVVSIPIGLLAFSWAAFGEITGLMPVLVSMCLVFLMRSFLQIWDFYRHDEFKGYWEAHAAMGGSLGRRLWNYGIFGEWRWGLIEALSFHLKAAVAIEASLSYLGFGVQEPQPSFGNMLASHFDLYLKGHWYILFLIVGALALCAATPNAASALFSKVLNRGPKPA